MGRFRRDKKPQACRQPIEKPEPLFPIRFDLGGIHVGIDQMDVESRTPATGPGKVSEAPPVSSQSLATKAITSQDVFRVKKIRLCRVSHV
jgi:hypothetical protein